MGRQKKDPWDTKEENSTVKEEDRTNPRRAAFSLCLKEPKDL